MLENPGQILQTSIYCMFLNMCILFSDPIVFVLHMGPWANKKKEFVSLRVFQQYFLHTSANSILVLKPGADKLRSVKKVD